MNRKLSPNNIKMLANMKKLANGNHLLAVAKTAKFHPRLYSTFFQNNNNNKKSSVIIS